MKLNNPLVLVSAKVLGVGIEIYVERVDDMTMLCVVVEAVIWSKCWSWGK